MRVRRDFYIAPQPPNTILLALKVLSGRWPGRYGLLSESTCFLPIVWWKVATPSDEIRHDCMHKKRTKLKYTTLDSNHQHSDWSGSRSSLGTSFCLEYLIDVDTHNAVQREREVHIKRNQHFFNFNLYRSGRSFIFLQTQNAWRSTAEP